MPKHDGQRAELATAPSISTKPDVRFEAAWIASAPQRIQETFLATLDAGALAALPYLFEFWAHPHQIPPEGDWRTWMILGGRGAGKTRAGAEWVRSEVEGATPDLPGRSRRLALVGETIDQTREVMVFGDSGILNCSPPDRRPVWEGGRRQLVWPNGATARVYSARDPEGLRGPQFDAAWVDELAKWTKVDAAWDMLQFSLRLGSHPRQCVTTTPRRVALLKDLIAAPSTVVTRAPTAANRAFLARSFLDEMEMRYAGSLLGRQELDGALLEDVAGALWTTSMIEAAQIDQVTTLDRIVVAVDPPVSGHGRSDECGIVVAGVNMAGAPRDWEAVVLADASIGSASPRTWANVVGELRARHEADRVVAEVNQGGDLVEAVMRQVDPMVPFRAVRARRGKVARAEPVATLYEQGRVRHVRGLGVLEDQMCRMTSRGFEGGGSPDRVDALVWALTDLMIDGAANYVQPRMRRLE